MKISESIGDVTYSYEANTVEEIYALMQLIHRPDPNAITPPRPFAGFPTEPSSGTLDSPTLAYGMEAEWRSAVTRLEQLNAALTKERDYWRKVVDDMNQQSNSVLDE